MTSKSNYKIKYIFIFNPSIVKTFLICFIAPYSLLVEIIILKIKLLNPLSIYKGNK
jgi:hypothetical protein